ncbi:MAG: hypothetical protein KHZ58_13555 [Hungatella hathewayi]|nr:hypothetical protein [Hungatella hathewayi]
MNEFVGLLLFLVITIVYFGVAVSVQLKWSRRMKESGERFREEAERDGRKVTAYLDNYIDEYTDGEHGYAADYYYTAPNGKRYKMRDVDCHFSVPPSEERTIYLHPRNYRKYYRGNMDLGQHSCLFVILTLIGWIGLYYIMMRFLFAPILLH